MGVRQWREKDMVRGWDQFSGPEGVKPMNSPNTNSASPIETARSWNNFPDPMTYQAPPDPNEEGWIEYLARNLASNASRAGEVILGTPGNIQQLGKQAKKYTA